MGQTREQKLEKEVRKSLEEQLEKQGKTAKFYYDLVNDYMRYWNLKEKLITDVERNGLRYKTINGNGLPVEKPNESVVNLQKTTATMLKILADLNLKEITPTDVSSEEGYY